MKISKVLNVKQTFREHIYSQKIGHLQLRTTEVMKQDLRNLAMPNCEVKQYFKDFKIFLHCNGMKNKFFCYFLCTE